MGDDPRCMIGWENPVKTLFGAMMVGSAIGSVILMLIVMCNMHRSALRKRIFVEELSGVAQGLTLLVLLFAINWVRIIYKQSSLMSFLFTYLVKQSLLASFVLLGKKEALFMDDSNLSVGSHWFI